jgi:glycosyltransferase involved in cell wall biosynthesis
MMNDSDLSLTILAVEPYFSGSHKAFLSGLQEYSQHTFQLVTLNGKGRPARIHIDSMKLAQEVKQLDIEPDILMLSSVMNVAAFLALTNPCFADTPKVMYMHENPLTQPLPPGEVRDEVYGYLHFLGMLAVDELLFASEFQRDDYLDSLPAFLKEYSDDPYTDQIEEIAQKARVLYPGLDLSGLDTDTTTETKEIKSQRPVIVWNQRWQYDRNPGMFFRVLNRLDDIDLDFDLILAGDTKHDKPEEFQKAWSRYGRRIKHFGYVEDPEAYARLLHQGDIVVSTATYEFFCVAIMEAIHCGCHPLVPDSLHYPELIPEHLHEPLLHAPVLYEDEDQLFHTLKSILQGESKPLPKATLKGINQHLDWPKRISTFDQYFMDVSSE